MYPLPRRAAAKRCSPTNFYRQKYQVSGLALPIRSFQGFLHIIRLLIRDSIDAFAPRSLPVLDSSAGTYMVSRLSFSVDGGKLALAALSGCIIILARFSRQPAAHAAQSMETGRPWHIAAGMTRPDEMVFMLFLRSLFNGLVCVSAWQQDHHFVPVPTGFPLPRAFITSRCRKRNMLQKEITSPTLKEEGKIVGFSRFSEENVNPAILGDSGQRSRCARRMSFHGGALPCHFCYNIVVFEGSAISGMTLMTCKQTLWLCSMIGNRRRLNSIMDGVYAINQPDPMPSPASFEQRPGWRHRRHLTSIKPARCADRYWSAEGHQIHPTGFL